MPVLLQEGRLLDARRASSQIQKGMFSNTERHVLKCRKASSQMQKGIFSNAEGHVLKYRRACSQIQKGPFFCLNTHILHSCGAKQIYIKIKYSSPSHDFHSPHPFPFHPHSTPFPSPTHSPLSVTPRTCSSVTLSSTTSNIFPCPLVLLSTCHIPLSLLAYNLFTRLPVNSSTCPLLLELVHLLPCLFSPPTCSLVHSSTRQLTMLLPELVHLLPCLLSHTTCSPSPRQPVNLQCYSPNLFICYPVSSRHQLVPLSTPQPVNLQCYSPNLFTCYHVY